MNTDAHGCFGATDFTDFRDDELNEVLHSIGTDVASMSGKIPRRFSQSSSVKSVQSVAVVPFHDPSPSGGFGVKRRRIEAF
ncbi:MAG TPA: hypothetical protein PKB10_05635 [Tepidisphaeraceae bacterium]|nr:hypothetical protein [Tepidisphaeraceae bacterium]